MESQFPILSMTYPSKKLLHVLVLSATLIAGSVDARSISIEIPSPAAPADAALWVALDAGPGFGSSILSLDDGRRIFLPFQADVLLQIAEGGALSVWYYTDYQWQSIGSTGFSLESGEVGYVLTLPQERSIDRVRAVQWFIEGADGGLAEHHVHAQRFGREVYLPRYYAVTTSGDLELKGRFGDVQAKPRIYQLLPRLFGNENETRKVNGTLSENGSGKFNDLSKSVLAGLRADGYTHVWLTGVIQQATSTDYSAVGQAADDPDLLKGIAGSPYAIRDYFDVSPDYAEDPAKRLEEFQALCERMKASGLKVLIDFVPNHVARSYASDIRPELAFGVKDRTDVYFDADNNFFYLTSEITDGAAPLRLPTVDHNTGQIINETAQLVGKADGYFPPERVHGRVTGNNVASWHPSNGDWYETVKLNYGFDFLNRDREPEYPSAITPRKRIPDTWKKMDLILAYWQELGVDGFRVDMAHMVPPEFWKWVIHRARMRNAETFFCAEAYNDDPAKVPSRDPALRESDSVMVALLDAGFDAVYDDPGYDTLEHLYTGNAWVNDLEQVQSRLGAFFFDCALRYTENHDEIRLAHPQTWGGLGMEVGRPVTATLFGLSRGPVMLYHGQKVGEPGIGREGFGGDDQRSTIFDYWSLPELNKWWNDGAADGASLSEAQRSLRAWYVRLLATLQEPAFAAGNSIQLNAANRENPFYGKVQDVGPSGHWFYSYLRTDPESDSHFLVTANFHAKATLRHVRVRLPQHAVSALGWEASADTWLVLKDRLGESGTVVSMPIQEVLREGLYLDKLEPLSAAYWEISTAQAAPAGARVPASLPAGNAFLGAPPVMRVRAGDALSIDLRRFGNPGETHRFAIGEVDGVICRVDTLNHRLMLQTNTESTGLKRLSLKLQPKVAGGSILESSLPLVVEPVSKKTFYLSGLNEVTAVSVVGAFNQWNTEASKMQKVEGGWTWTGTIEPGRYVYKYVIDGRWEADPANPEREADGYGGFNSVLNVESGAVGLPPATLIVESVTAEAIEISADRPLRQVIAEALPKTGGTMALSATVEEGRIVVAHGNTAPKGAMIRVLAETDDGQVGLPAITFAGSPVEDIWQDDIIYYAFTDRFYDGDPGNTQPVEDTDVLSPANYQGGDFAGIRQKLEEGYFEDLGVNVLWLAPLNQNPEGAWQEYLEPFRHYTGYHGYWPVSRYGVERRFGGEAALRELVNAAHANEVKMLADFVLKHVHEENPIRRERPELFGQLELSDGTRNLRRWNDNPFTTWFEPFLPAFDFRNPDAIEFLLEDATYWIDAYGLDGYRLDAVKHIRPDFWWRFRTRMRDTFPDANYYFVGETFQNRQGIADFVGPNMLDGQFDFPLYDILVPCFAEGQVSFAELEKALRESEMVYGRSVRMSPLLGNHDKSRFMAYADGDLPNAREPDDEEVGWSQQLVVDDPSAYEKLKQAMTFLLTIDGVPMIYYGDEIGMTGAGDPDNRRMMRFGDQVSAAEDSVRVHFSKLAHARRGHPSLYLGSRRVLLADQDHYAYVRAYNGDLALVAFNRSAAPVTLTLELQPEMDNVMLDEVLSGRTLKIANGQALLTLEPMSSVVFVNGSALDAN
jgi:glycosidase